jgi:oligosaccharyl transferase (archaeosortase A-associated)
MDQRSRADADLTRPSVYLAAIVVAALVLRVVFSYPFVITPAFVNFQDNDAWYHMRLIDSLVAHWPHTVRGDPYVGGAHIPIAPLFDVLVSGVALAVGFGSPSPRQVEIVAAFAPAVMGALLPLPIFAAGARLFGRKAGLYAAALVAILPGQFLERSRLGDVDHHVAEALLSAVVLALLVRALQQRTIRHQVVGAAWAGVALGAYLLSWASGAYLVGILGAWIVAQYCVMGRGDANAAVPGRVVVVTSLVALPIVLLLQDSTLNQFKFQVLFLVGVALAGFCFDTARGLAEKLRLTHALAPAIALLLLGAGLAAASRVFPGAVFGALRDLRRLVPDHAAVETMSLVGFATAPWTTRNPWLVFGTGLPLGVAGLAMLCRVALRRQRPELLLTLVWTVIMLASTLVRNRFGYYLVPMFALLGGWVCAAVTERARGRSRDIVAAAIGALAFAPNLWPARQQVRTDAGISRAWFSAVEWLRHATPEPFGDESFYQARYTERTAPSPSNTVMAWWDYGYWIVRGAHRVPVSIPTQAGAAVSAAFLMESDPDRAGEILRATRSDFVVVDWQLPFRIVPAPVRVAGKFETLVHWANRPASEYYEAMYVRGDSGELLPALVFYPAYYKTMVNRLYQFGGRAVSGSNPTVITYADRRSADGSAFREITATRAFFTYPEAQAYLTALGTGPHRLVGTTPNASPVPLPDLPEFSRAWSSDEAGPWPGTAAVVVFRHRR